MAVQVSYPGVYIDEVSSGVHTITSVSTSIAAFFGRASKGRMNKATRCLSLADYARAFGAPHPQSDLANAVRQFFANGGTDCYVVRIANGATFATATLRNLAPAPMPVLVATAKSEGTWANQLRLVVDYATMSPHDSFNLRVIWLEGNNVVATENFLNLSMNYLSPRFAPTFVSQSSELIDLALAPGLGDPTLPASFIRVPGNSLSGYSQSRRALGADANAAAAAIQALITAGQDSFLISVNDGPAVPVALGASIGGAPPPPLAGGTLAADLTNRINTALSAVLPAQTVAVTLEIPANVGVLLNITSTSGDASAVRITRATSRDIAGPLLLGADQGGLEQTRYSNFRPAPNATIWRVRDAAGAPANVNPLTTRAHVNAIAGFVQGGAGHLVSVTVDGQPAVILDAAPFNLQTGGVAGAGWHVDAAGTGDGVREKLDIIVAAINAQVTNGFRAERWGYDIALLSKNGSLNLQPSAVGAAPAPYVADRSINTAQYTLGTSGTSAFATGTDGSEGGAPTTADYFGNAAAQTGFHALDPVDLFNLLVLPADEGVPPATHALLWGPASVYCASRRAFLLVDSPPAWTSPSGRPVVVGGPQPFISALGVSVTTHSAVFYPRLVYMDGILRKKIGPAGAIAGVMARTDATRGVWKAPAGLEADVRDVLDVEVKLTDAENGVLNKRAINCIRRFPNGLVSWGARTMAGDDDVGSEWKYIPIRRLALMLEESLFRGTKWVVFEPNDEPLWAKIRLNINAYMMSLFRQGAFQGTSPKDAFYVKCDKDTTTQDDRNKGIVNIEVGFAPLKPAEFVVIKIQQIAGDL